MDVVAEPARILVVCTGNVCRSPLTERLLRARLSQRGVDDVAVHSAGTGALAGATMTPQTAELLQRHGGDGSQFVSRDLTRPMVEAATLVLALTRAHRGVIVALHPRATRYTFTLREAARLLPLVAELGEVPGEGPAARLRALPALLASRRGLVPVLDPAADDVIDPYRRSAHVYEQMSSEVVPAVEALVDAIAARR